MTEPTKFDTDAASVRVLAQTLIDVARSRGLVVTISTKPRHPLATGNYDLDIEVRQVREATRP